MTRAYDPQLAPWVDVFPPYDFSDLTALRAEQDRLNDHMPPYEAPVPLSIDDVVVPGDPGVPVRIYAPKLRHGPLPAMVYFHGGGFIMGSVNMFDHVTRRMAAEGNLVVIAVSYRLAPEHPFPAGLEDGYRALLWAHETADEHGINRSRLAVGGDSAGGGLAAGLALLARDRGGPPLCFQYLGAPPLDDTLSTPSMQAYDDTPIWYRSAAVYSWDCYLGQGKPGTPDVSPYAAPARARDLTGLPSAYVYVYQVDPLRDEGIDYAQRLAHAEVPTELALYSGTFHASPLVPDAASSARIFDSNMAALRRSVHQLDQ